MKISEAFDAYTQSQVVAKGLSASTFSGYQNTGKALIQYFGNIKVAKIRVTEIEQFYIDLVNTERINGRKHHPNTARAMVCQIKTVWAFLNRRGSRVVDASEISLPKLKKTVPVWLEKDEIERFLEAVSTPVRGYPRINRLRNALIVEMLFVTGLRVSELCALNRNSIRDKELVVVGKSKDPRVCFITDSIQEKIDEYLGWRTDDNPALFVSGQTGGKRLTASTIRLIFRNTCKRSEFRGVHPHTMRHSFGTYLLSNGANVRAVAELLGHQSLDTTKVYLHYKNTDLKMLHHKIMEENA